jgi:hypothetical protein
VRYVPAWVPGVQFKKLAEEWSQLAVQLFDRPFGYVKDQMVCLGRRTWASLISLVETGNSHSLILIQAPRDDLGVE